MRLHNNFLRWKSNPLSVSTEEQRLFSRRQFLQGGAAAAFIPNIAAVLLSGRVEFRHGEGKASFWLDGSERWVLDPTVFAGDGTLVIEKASPHLGRVHTIPNLC